MHSYSLIELPPNPISCTWDASQSRSRCWSEVLVLPQRTASTGMVTSTDTHDGPSYISAEPLLTCEQVERTITKVVQIVTTVLDKENGTDGGRLSAFKGKTELTVNAGASVPYQTGYLVSNRCLQVF